MERCGLALIKKVMKSKVAGKKWLQWYYASEIDVNQDTRYCAAQEYGVCKQREYVYTKNNHECVNFSLFLAPWLLVWTKSNSLWILCGDVDLWREITYICTKSEENPLLPFPRYELEKTYCVSLVFSSFCALTNTAIKLKHIS